MGDPTGLMQQGPKQVEPVDRMLASLLIFFVLLLVGVSLWSPNDGQTFQVLGNLASGAMGAILARVKPSGSSGSPGRAAIIGDGNVVTQEPKE